MSLPKVGTRVCVNKYGANRNNGFLKVGKMGQIVSVDPRGPTFNIQWDDGEQVSIHNWPPSSWAELDYLSDECSPTLRSGDLPKTRECKCGIVRSDCFYHKD